MATPKMRNSCEECRRRKRPCVKIRKNSSRCQYCSDWNLCCRFESSIQGQRNDLYPDGRAKVLKVCFEQSAPKSAPSPRWEMFPFPHDTELKHPAEASVTRSKSSDSKRCTRGTSVSAAHFPLAAELKHPAEASVYRSKSSDSKRCTRGTRLIAAHFPLAAKLKHPAEASVYRSKSSDSKRCTRGTRLSAAHFPLAEPNIATHHGLTIHDFTTTIGKDEQSTFLLQPKSNSTGTRMIFLINSNTNELESHVVSARAKLVDDHKRVGFIECTQLKPSVLRRGCSQVEIAYRHGHESIIGRLQN